MGTSDNDSQQNTTEESSSLNSENVEVISDSEIIIDDSDIKVNISDPIITETVKPLVSEKQLSGTTISSSDETTVEQPTIGKINKPSSIIAQNNQNSTYIDCPGIIRMKKSVFVHPEIYSNNYKPEKRDFTQSIQDEILIDPKINISNSRWKIGYYIAPELSISDFDSVQILNSYTVSVEPSYFFSDHWFTSIREVIIIH